MPNVQAKQMLKRFLVVVEILLKAKSKQTQDKHQAADASPEKGEADNG
jgi:hypothetical protein